jgi:drug/metabolite transporter (DMT)-like permease
MNDDSASTLRSGGLLAVGAALSFGVTTPVISHASRLLGPFSTAAMLYLGACLSTVFRTAHGTASIELTPAQRLRVVAMALLGAAIAPALFVWGLERTGATTGALVLNAEAVFTLVLGVVVYREPLSRRAVLAVVLMVLGGTLLALRTRGPSSMQWQGLAALIGATFGWALDNTLARSLANVPPISIVARKSAFGVVATTAVAFLVREPMPDGGATLVLLACGFVGYGLSLRMYLSAQQAIGAARTASIFALAPFIGAALGLVLGDSAGLGWLVASGFLFALGTWLHLSERHHHLHRHAALEHEHVHTHDDGHHLHVHEPPVSAAHSHRHRHDPLEHDHEHGVDLHHDHHGNPRE